VFRLTRFILCILIITSGWKTPTLKVQKLVYWLRVSESETLRTPSKGKVILVYITQTLRRDKDITSLILNLGKDTGERSTSRREIGFGG
jgi:hypothetical protein